jgi:hypothetical protein
MVRKALCCGRLTLPILFLDPCGHFLAPVPASHLDDLNLQVPRSMRSLVWLCSDQCIQARTAKRQA